MTAKTQINGNPETPGSNPGTPETVVETEISVEKMWSRSMGTYVRVDYTLLFDPSSRKYIKPVRVEKVDDETVKLIYEVKPGTYLRIRSVVDSYDDEQEIRVDVVRYWRERVTEVLDGDGTYLLKLVWKDVTMEQLIDSVFFRVELGNPDWERCPRIIADFVRARPTAPQAPEIDREYTREEVDALLTSILNREDPYDNIFYCPPEGEE